MKQICWMAIKETFKDIDLMKGEDKIKASLQKQFFNQ